MLLGVGTKVKLIHTGVIGTIVELLDSDTALVEMAEDGDEIPISLDNLQPASDRKVSGARVLTYNAPQPSPRPDLSPPQPQYHILKSQGIQLAFEPSQITGGDFVLYLLNDTRQEVVYDITLQRTGRSPKSWQGRMDGVQALKLDVFPFDALNDQPTFDFDIRTLTTEGTGPALRQQLRIKAKQFFKRLLTAPLLQRKMYVYRILDKLEPKDSSTSQPKTPGEDLRAYTLKQGKPIKHSNYEKLDSRDAVQRYAAFSTEIDLHLDQLTDEPGKVQPRDRLRMQLAAFEKYIDQAVQLGMERVFIIHGVGEGVLRDRIASQLIRHPQVASFKNEFHPRYGFGATEVIFR